MSITKTSVNFSRWLSEFSKEALDISGQDAETLSMAAQELKRRVVERTPVGTPLTSDHPGLLKKSWRLDQGSSRTNDGRFSSPTDNVAQGGITLKPIPNFVLSNQQPYAQRIEYGWSKQAPEGMLRISLAEWGDILAMYKKTGSGKGLIVYNTNTGLI